MKKVWLKLRRAGVNVARCTVERLMRAMGRVGIRRGKGVKTPCSDKDAATPDDLVNRRFIAERPNQLWLADFTYVSTAQGFVYVAFIVDVFAGVIVGWRVSTSMATSLVREALAQALWARRPGKGVNHHSDQGSHSVSLAYSKRLKGAEILASVGTTGDACDNAMAESINGVYKTEVNHRGSWKNRMEVALATLDGVDGYNNRRLLGRLSYLPPTEAEMNYYASQ